MYFAVTSYKEKTVMVSRFIFQSYLFPSYLFKSTLETHMRWQGGEGGGHPHLRHGRRRNAPRVRSLRQGRFDQETIRRLRGTSTFACFFAFFQIPYTGHSSDCR
jgi:hypothetical protein